MRQIRFTIVSIGFLVVTIVAAQETRTLRFIFPSNGQIIYGSNILLWVGGLPVGALDSARAVVFEASTDKS